MHCQQARLFYDYIPSSPTVLNISILIIMPVMYPPTHSPIINPQLSSPNQGTMIENGMTIKEMLHVTCYMSHVSFIAHKSQLPEQQGTMVAETALLTSTEALKKNSFAPTSFFLRISFHGELPPNLRNKRIIVHRYRNHLQDLLTPF